MNTERTRSPRADRRRGKRQTSGEQTPGTPTSTRGARLALAGGGCLTLVSLTVVAVRLGRLVVVHDLLVLRVDEVFEVGFDRLDRVLLADHVGGFLADHHLGGIGVTGHRTRDDRGVGDAQSLDTTHAANTTLKHMSPCTYEERYEDYNILIRGQTASGESNENFSASATPTTGKVGWIVWFTTLNATPIWFTIHFEPAQQVSWNSKKENVQCVSNR